MLVYEMASCLVFQLLNFIDQMNIIFNLMLFFLNKLVADNSNVINFARQFQCAKGPPRRMLNSNINL